MSYSPKAQAAYDKKCTFITAKLYPGTDRDIIEFMAKQSEPTATLIKRLIREEIARRDEAHK